MGIFWQKGAMEISSHDVFVENAFTAVFSVISVSVEHVSKRFVVSDVCPSSMIFKAHNGKGEIRIFQNNACLSYTRKKQMSTLF